jgi:hypothetical protein
MRESLEAGSLPRGRNASETVGYVEIGFVERERLDQWGVVLEDHLNLFGHFAVNVEPWATNTSSALRL